MDHQELPPSPDLTGHGVEPMAEASDDDRSPSAGDVIPIVPNLVATIIELPLHDGLPLGLLLVGRQRDR